MPARGRPTNWTTEIWEYALLLSDKGLTSKEIAKELSRYTGKKFSPEAVRFQFHSRGHSLRAKKEVRGKKKVDEILDEIGTKALADRKDLASRIKTLFDLKGIPLKPERKFTDKELERLYEPKGIIFFAEEVLGVTLYDYQKEMLYKIKNNDMVAFIAGRQVGKSFVMAIVALYLAFTEVCNVAVASRSLDQAQLLYLIMKQFILPKRQLADSVSNLSKEGITFKNGSTIKFFSGLTPEGILGMSKCHLIVDEFTFIGNRFFELANPVRAVGSKKLICAGTAGYVDRSLWSWQLWFQNEDIEKMTIPSSANPNITEEFLQSQRRIFDSDTYAALYECQWVDQADKWFSWKVVHAATEDYVANAVIPEKDAVYNIGIDPSYSGTGDYACISVVKRFEVVRDKVRVPAYRLVYFYRFKPETMEELLAQINFVREAYGQQVNSVVVDGSDFRLVEALENMGLYVTPYNFASEGRNNLMKTLKATIEQGRLILPNDMDLIREFCSLKYRVTSFGRLQITSPGHDDQVVAIGMSIMPDERSFIENLPSSAISFPLPFAVFKRETPPTDSKLTALQKWRPKLFR